MKISKFIKAAATLAVAALPFIGVAPAPASADVISTNKYWMVGLACGVGGAPGPKAYASIHYYRKGNVVRIMEVRTNTYEYRTKIDRLFRKDYYYLHYSTSISVGPSRARGGYVLALREENFNTPRLWKPAPVVIRSVWQVIDARERIVAPSQACVVSVALSRFLR